MTRILCTSGFNFRWGWSFYPLKKYAAMRLQPEMLTNIPKKVLSSPIFYVAIFFNFFCQNLSGKNSRLEFRSEFQSQKCLTSHNKYILKILTYMLFNSVLVWILKSNQIQRVPQHDRAHPISPKSPWIKSISNLIRCLNLNFDEKEICERPL